MVFKISAWFRFENDYSEGYSPRLHVQTQAKVQGGTPPDYPRAAVVGVVHESPHIQCGKTWVLVRSGLACYGKPWRGEDWVIQNGLPYEGIPLGTVPLG